MWTWRTYLCPGAVEDCCLKYVKKVRPGIRKHVTNYRVQVPDGGCNIRAIVWVSIICSANSINILCLYLYLFIWKLWNGKEKEKLTLFNLFRIRCPYLFCGCWQVFFEAGSVVLCWPKPEMGAASHESHWQNQGTTTTLNQIMFWD